MTLALGLLVPGDPRGGVWTAVPGVRRSCSWKLADGALQQVDWDSWKLEKRSLLLREVDFIENS